SVACRFVGIHTIAKDVTERNNLLRALTRNEHSLRLLQRALDSSHNGVIIADASMPDHPATYTNPAFERMMGYQPNDILGKSSSFLYEATPGQPETKNILERLMQSH